MSSATQAHHTSRILICRLSHIGDCLLTLPMVSALRKALPDAWISWAVERPADQLIELNPDVNELIIVPKRWLKRPRSIGFVRRQLRQRRFDIALDPQSLTKSAMLGWLSGAPLRIGFGGRHGREMASWLNNKRVKPCRTHLVDRSLELLGELGIENPSATFDLPIPESAEVFVDHFLVERGMNSERFLVINPGASWPSKRWETDRFGQVASRLYEMTGLRSIVTWAGDLELEMATRICAVSQGAARLAPPTDLRQLAALIQRADLFLGCDTGPLHLAAAVDTTCVGLYGPTRPQDSGAYGSRHLALQCQYQSGSSRQRRLAPNTAMKKIEVPMVVDACCRAIAATRLLDRKTSREKSPDAAA